MFGYKSKTSKFSFTQNDLCATSDKNTNFYISKNLLCKVGISNSLRSRTVYSSLFSKDKLKHGAHIHQTHDPPSPRLSWENCSAVPSQQLPRVLCGAGTRQERVFYTRVVPGH